MAVATTYRNKLPGFSDSSSDDEDDCDIWKRNTKNTAAPPVVAVNEPIPGNPSKEKRKVNNIWSNVIIEEAVSEDLGQIGLALKPEGALDRSCENYDYTRRELDTRPDPMMDEGMDSDVISCDEYSLSSAYSEDEKSVSKSNEKSRKICKELIDKKFVKLKKPDVMIAKKILWKLGEKNKQLIFRVVHFLGSEKSLELLGKTIEVESNGGMLIKNQSRRRTPGGVFLCLLKEDSSISKQQKDDIFGEEVPFKEMQKRKAFWAKKNGTKHFKKQRKPRKRSKQKGKPMDCSSETMTLSSETTIASNETVITPSGTMITSNDTINVPVTNTKISTEIKTTPLNNEDLDLEDGEIADSEDDEIADSEDDEIADDL